MKRSLLIVIVIAALAGAAGVYFGTQHHLPAAPESPAVATLFAQQLPDPDGKSHALAQWQGKPLVVNFWATWCPPCVDEMPELSALQTELAPKGVQIIGIGIDSPSNIREFAAKYKIAYPLFVAGMTGTELSRQFGNQNGGLPFTALIDKDGRITKTYIGRLKMDQLRADIARLK